MSLAFNIQEIFGLATDRTYCQLAVVFPDVIKMMRKQIK